MRGISFAHLLAGSVIFLVACSTLRPGHNPRQLVLEKSWVRSTLKSEFLGYRRMNRMTPIVLEQIIISGNAIDGIVAYERKSGQEAWRVSLQNGVEGGAQVVSGKLYFGSSDGQFYCVDAASGKVLWTFPVRAETLAPPLVVDGVVYFESGADLVYALDANSGKQIWVYNRQTTTTLSVRATTRPTVIGNSVYVGFSDGFIAALRKRDGTLLWDRKLGTTGRFRDVDSTPVFDDGKLYVASFDESLYALKADTGEVVWQTENGGYTAATVVADHIYFATSEGFIQSLDKASGKIIWSNKVGHGIATQPSFYKGYLFYGESDGGIASVDATSGRFITRFNPGRGLISQPAIVPETGELYFISNNANLFALKIVFERPSDRLPWQ